MRRLLGVMWAVALAAALVAPVGALEWRGKAPLVVTVESDATTLKPYVDAAMAAWGESAVIDMVYGTKPKGGQPLLTVTEYIGEPDSGGAAGTFIAARGNRITEARIGLNSAYVLLPEVWAYTVCHEFGHALGLDHDSAPGEYNHGCMNVTWQGRPIPSPYDLDTLLAMYR